MPHNLASARTFRNMLNELNFRSLSVIARAFSLRVSCRIGKMSVFNCVATLSSSAFENLFCLLLIHSFPFSLNYKKNLLYIWVTLLGLACFTWEQDQLGFVELETLSIQLQRLYRLVTSSVIHCNADGLGILLVQTGSLKIVKWNLKSFVESKMF